MGIVEAAKRNLAMQVRVGVPNNISGLIDEIVAPGFAAGSGLVLYAAKTGVAMREKFSFNKIGKIAEKLPISGAAGKVIDLIKSFLP